MNVTVRIPAVVEGEFGFEDSEIDVSVDTESPMVRTVLQRVAERYPGASEYFHPDGDRHDDIQVMVNGSLVLDFTQPVDDGDAIQVALPIAGG